jgi:hypothetical protein
MYGSFSSNLSKIKEKIYLSLLDKKYFKEIILKQAFHIQLTEALDSNIPIKVSFM